MFTPGPATMPMDSYGRSTSWGPSSNFNGEIYVRMLPSQFAEARLRFDEGENVSRLEVQVFSNYQMLSPLSIRILIYQAINQTEVSIFLSWANVFYPGC